MYYVYKIHFPELNAIYIGCTSNLRRRKDQHNENARKRKSYLGRFLADNNIRLQEKDLQVVEEHENRSNALGREREIALSLKDTGIHLLNDTYSNHATRKGLRGTDNPSTKTYVVIDTKEHTTTLVNDMHEWCVNHSETSYKTMIGTAKRKPKMHAGRYIARHTDEWETMSDTEREDLINGTWYTESVNNTVANGIDKRAKLYLLKTPKGFMFVRNLDRFARENGINSGNLHASLSTGRPAQGYKVVERLA